MSKDYKYLIGATILSAVDDGYGGMDIIVLCTDGSRMEISMNSNEWSISHAE